MTDDLDADAPLPSRSGAADPTPPRRPRPTGPIQYKGDDLEAERGPGLGCFRFQVVVLVVFIVLTPLSVAWGWPEWLSAALLFAVILLLLITGQTIIFLLRLVAADRRGRRRPLASETKTVGELEDEASGARTRTTATPDDRRAERLTRPRRPRRRASPTPTARLAARPRAPCDNRRPGRREPARNVRPDRSPWRIARRARARDLLLRPPRPRPVLQVLHAHDLPEAGEGLRGEVRDPFIGWYNVAHGWDFDNVILLDLPDYATLDKLEKDEGHPRARPPGRRVDLRAPPLDVPARADGTRPRIPSMTR